MLHKPAVVPVLLIAAVAATAFVQPAHAAKPWWMRGTDNNENDFLPPDVAFRAGATVVGNHVHLRWVIADGYYLYKHKIEVKAESPDLVMGDAQLPQVVMKSDPYLGRQEIYTQQVETDVPYTRSDFGAHPIQVKVTYQGCAEAGLCYPPVTKVLFPVSASADAGALATGMPQSAASAPHLWQLIAMIAGMLAFLAAGLALRRGRSLPLPTQ